MQGENPGGFDRLSHPVGWILDARNWMLEKIEMQIRHSSFVTRHLIRGNLTGLKTCMYFGYNFEKLYQRCQWPTANGQKPTANSQ
jgi:hypothetical protein